MTQARIAVIPGDGIGPEIMEATLKVLEALDPDLAFDQVDAGQSALDEQGELLPQATLDTIQSNGTLLKGPITTPVGKGFTSVNVSLRKHFDLYANVRPALTWPGIPARYQDVDIITVRENIEGVYSGIGQTISDDGERAELRSVVTRSESRRLLEYAFNLAQRRGRKKVTVVHKANIMKTTSGLFLETAQRVAEDFPDLEYQEMIVDNCAMQLVLDPHQFDTLVTTNLFGDILSDLCAGLVGGLGVAPGANIGDDVAMFEAVHGSAPDIAGKGVANPTALMLAAAMMLDHIGMAEAAERLRKAIGRALEDGQVLTPDLGGSASTSDYAEAVIRQL
ncbi:MAG: isocitrate dehydrogenase [Marinobacter sp.]|uniref:isocitrate dehydrogenase n=1 Tax=Marinobacter sp. TaxID=50741 RepID=UPI00299E9D7A|nr:isocitrate dehydrogenase [Marinobacter sp.]MDX1635632.1 isocitrate dehydrogenase [Marinobacter sp.]